MHIRGEGCSKLQEAGPLKTTYILLCPCGECRQGLQVIPGFSKSRITSSLEDVSTKCVSSTCLLEAVRDQSNNMSLSKPS